jgi:hypothetical protein
MLKLKLLYFPFSEIFLLYEWTILLGGTTVRLESHHHFESDRVYSVDLANGGLIGKYSSFNLSIFYFRLKLILES